MNGFTPLGKQSKKAKTAYYKAMRTTWGPLSPVTRRPENPKAYNRKKARRELDSSLGGPFVFF